MYANKETKTLGKKNVREERLHKPWGILLI